MTVRQISPLAFVFALTTLVGCGVEPDVDALDENAAPVEHCGFDDDVLFEPQEGEQLQWRGDGACALLSRAPRGNVRRGIEWDAERLVVVTSDHSYDLGTAALAYENSHHNCKDRAVAEAEGVALVVDGLEEDVCFGTDIALWRGILDVAGQRFVLEPVNVPEHDG